VQMIYSIYRQAGVSPLVLCLFLTGSAYCAAEPIKQEDSNQRHPISYSGSIISLKGQYQDYPSSMGIDPGSLLFGQLSSANSFVDLCAHIDTLAQTRSVQYVLFDLSSQSLSMNLAHLAELPRHIQKLHAAGIKTFAWLENADSAHYIIASACNTILMAKLGSLDLPSLSMTVLHFRDAMELLGICADFARVGAYKAAIEPFTLSEMSPEIRTHYTEMLTSMNQALVKSIAQGRQVDESTVRAWQQERFFSAQTSLNKDLIDYTTDIGAVKTAISNIQGHQIRWTTQRQAPRKQISLFDLMGKIMDNPIKASTKRPSVAVLHLNGQIVHGNADLPGYIVSSPTIKEIESLARDRNIRAVVVRINSPGGSVIGSEAIYQAMKELADQKPVVISMGSMAASGAYWISCLDCPLFAEPGTLTGSIGVFAMHVSIGPLLEKIGLRMEHVTLDNSAQEMSLSQTWTPSTQNRMQGLLDQIYDQFLTRVAEARHLAKDSLRPLAGGRVWSGAQALDLGLVDHLGGLDEAVKSVAKKANLPQKFELIHRPHKKSLFEILNLFNQPLGEGKYPLNEQTLKAIRDLGWNLATPLGLIRNPLPGASHNNFWLLAPTEFKFQ
jgi:protease IV